MRVFVTMQAKADMSLFEWQRHVEELRLAIAKSVHEKDWGYLKIYGPDSGGFDPLPGICIETIATAESLGTMMELLAEASPWLELPVKVFVASPVSH